MDDAGNVFTWKAGMKVIVFILLPFYPFQRIRHLPGDLRGIRIEGNAFHFRPVIAGEAPYEGDTHTRYIEVETALKYVAETIRAFGYVKAQDTGISTMLRAFRYYALEQGWRIQGRCACI